MSEEIEVARAAASADAHVKAWDTVKVEGVTLFTSSTERGTGGVAVFEGETTARTGTEAMQALVERVGDSPDALAHLAILFLEGIPNKRSPLAAAPAGSDERLSEWVSPPSLEAEVLTYWRKASRGSDLIRVTVDLKAGTYEHHRGSSILREADIKVDPMAIARKELSSPNKYTQRNGIEVLTRCGSTEAADLLVETMLNADYPETREAAARAQQECVSPRSVHELGRALLGDASANVRLAALEVLGGTGDPAVIGMIEGAIAQEKDAKVLGTAQRMLNDLKN